MAKSTSDNAPTLAVPAPSIRLLELAEELRSNVGDYAEIKARCDRAVAERQACINEAAELERDRIRAGSLAEPRTIARLEERAAVLRERGLEASAAMLAAQREIEAAALEVERLRGEVSKMAREELGPFVKAAVATVERLAGELMTTLHMLADIAPVAGAVLRRDVRVHIPHPSQEVDLGMRPVDVGPAVGPWRAFRAPLRNAEATWQDRPTTVEAAE